MKAILISLTATYLGAASFSSAFAQSTATISNTPLYTNCGDNTTGFNLKFGGASFTVDNHMLVGTEGGGWYSLPVYVSGDFQVDFDVYPDANDAASALMLYDDSNNRGVLMFNCTETTFSNTNIGIYSVNDLTNHDQFYFPNSPLGIAPAKNFTVKAWTHITIIKKGNTLTDNVGGQVISADLSKEKLPFVLRVGLGYYATTNVGGDGEIGYANLRIVRLKPQ